MNWRSIGVEGRRVGYCMNWHIVTPPCHWSGILCILLDPCCFDVIIDIVFPSLHSYVGQTTTCHSQQSQQSSTSSWIFETQFDLTFVSKASKCFFCICWMSKFICCWLPIDWLKAMHGPLLVHPNSDVWCTIGGLLLRGGSCCATIAPGRPLTGSSLQLLLQLGTVHFTCW